MTKALILMRLFLQINQKQKTRALFVAEYKRIFVSELTLNALSPTLWNKLNS